MKHTVLRHHELRNALLAQCQLSDSHPVQLRVAVEEPSDLILWLQAQKHRPRLFWTDRRREHRVAAAGKVRTWPDLASAQAAIKACDPSLRVYGGWAFNTQNPSTQNPWKKWPTQYFFLPRWEMRQTPENKKYLCLNLWGDASREIEITQALEQLILPKSQDQPLSSSFVLEALHDTPNRQGWNDMLISAQKHFDSGHLQKLVLSKVSCSKVPGLQLHLMQRLLDRQRQAYHFWFEPFENSVLWGASPERLYTRTGRIVKTEALAGTRPSPENPDQVLAFRDELLHSPKEQQENERVQEHIEKRLGPLSSSFWMEPLTVIQAGPVQHLYRQIKAEIHPGIQDDQLVKTLHPTPAVSGYPSQLAIEALEDIEPHERGWYTGALGWISSGAAEWTVVLRVALWQDNCMYFYTGAGIMPDSDPDAEWDELEAKLLSLKTLFY